MQLNRLDAWDKLFTALSKLEVRAKVEGQRELFEEMRKQMSALYDDETKCPHDPKELAGQPIGMYHCPECGEMVIAGVDHP